MNSIILASDQARHSSPQCPYTTLNINQAEPLKAFVNLS